MSIFLATLAFDDASLLANAKVVALIISAVVGLQLGRACIKRQRVLTSSA